MDTARHELAGGVQLSRVGEGEKKNERNVLRVQMRSFTSVDGLAKHNCIQQSVL